MEEYDRVWERFVGERRLEFGGYMDPDWQEGHRLSASLVVPGGASRFHERLEPLREALRPFPFVSLHPDHFMHVTLVLVGFLVDDPKEEDEVSRERLQEIEERTRIALCDVPTFTVRFANLNAFPGAAFIEAHDRGMLDWLRVEETPRSTPPYPRLLPSAGRHGCARGTHRHHRSLQRLAHRRDPGGERGDDLA